MEIITLADLRAMIKAEKDLKDLKSTIDTAYTALCALCNEPIDNHTDDDDEEDDEPGIKMSDCRALVHYVSKSTDVALFIEMSDSTDLALADDEFDEDFYLQPPPEKVCINGVVTDEDDPIVPSRQLFKMIRQASHPDKLMRYSADDKQAILDCFYDAKRFYEEDDYAGLTFCYVKIFVIKKETRKINLRMWRFLKQRNREVLLHSQFLLGRDYMPAIWAFQKGEIEMAKRLFRQYLKHGKPDDFDDMDCFID